ncbi:MAG: integrin alpha [Myxococcota bacterium]
MAAAFWLIALNLGCDPACEGAGCGSLYPAADLHLFLGSTLATDRLDPEADADGRVAGEADEGFDWALAGVEGGVLAGVPLAGEVRLLTDDSFAGGGVAGVLTGEEADDRFGAALAAAGDTLLVGAPGRAAGTGSDAAGAVYRFDGTDLAGDATLVVTGGDAQDRLGTAVASCGDLNGDGEADWAASAPWADDGGDLSGSVYVSTDATLAGVVGLDRLTLLAGPAEAGGFGTAIACAASLDGDPLPELLVGAPYVGGEAGAAAGVVRVWRGSSGFPGAVVANLAGEQAGDYFGSAIAAGDLDGDGVPELAVGAPGHSSDESGEDDTAGAVYVFRGTDLVEHLNVPEFVAGELEPAWTLRGVWENGRFGDALLVADLTGDDLDDLIVGAPGHNPTGERDAVQSGAAWLFAGDADAWPSAQYAQDAALMIGGERQYLRTGERLAVGDVDADGVPDLVVLTRAEAE